MDDSLSVKEMAFAIRNIPICILVNSMMTHGDCYFEKMLNGTL